MALEKNEYDISQATVNFPKNGISKAHELAKIIVGYIFQPMKEIKGKFKENSLEKLTSSDYMSNYKRLY